MKGKKYGRKEYQEEKIKNSSTTLFYIECLFVIKPRDVAQVPICSNQFPKNNQVKKPNFIIQPPITLRICLQYRDLGLIPGLGRSVGDRKGYPLQYSGLENSMSYTNHGRCKESDTTESLSLSFSLKIVLQILSFGFKE